MRSWIAAGMALFMALLTDCTPDVTNSPTVQPATPMLPAVVRTQPVDEESTGTETASTSSLRAGLRFVVITHGQPGDPFWTVVRRGAEQAGGDLGVEVEYRSPSSSSFDIGEMSALIDDAVDSQPAGLVVSIPDPAALGPSIRAAIDADIPIISINSGSEVAKDLGLLNHVGQTEYEAGFGAGERMIDAGVSQALCVNHEVGNTALDLRCQGFADALAHAGGTVEMVAMEMADLTGGQQSIQAALKRNNDIDGILGTGPVAMLSTLNAVRAVSRQDAIQVAGFDLTPEVLEAIRAGDVLFAIDQQPYLQGYVPIVLLTLHTTNLNTVANDVIPTGPGFVTKKNVDQVIELTEQGTR